MTVFLAVFLVAVLAGAAGHPLGQRRTRPAPLSDFASKEEARRAFSELEAAMKLRSGGVDHLRQLFEEWKQLNGVTYPASEDAQRFATFQRSVKNVVKVNNDPTTEHWAGLTLFAATSNREFSNMLMQNHEPPPLRDQQEANSSSYSSSRAARPRASYPSAKDWAADAGVTAVRDQGGCGSCWAFAGVASIEARLKILANKDYDFSEQQIVDCQKAAGACDGGSLDDAFNYATSANLFEEKTSGYSYKAKELSCRASAIVPGATRVRLSGVGKTGTFATKEELMEEVGNNGPVVIGFAVDTDFKLYKGGVYTKDTTTTNECKPELGWHAVILVGYDDTAGYWKFKNSWGAGWGEKGYFKMKITAGKAAYYGSYGPCYMYWDGGYWPLDPTVTVPDLCATVVCDAPCKVRGTCSWQTGICSYGGNAARGSSCSTDSIDEGVCDGKGACVANLCIGKSCDVPCKTGPACDPFTGKCSYKANSAARSACTNGTTDPGVCDGKGNCVPDLCAGKSCELPCKTGPSCDVFTGKCSYKANAAARATCTNGTTDPGVCDGKGNCVPDLCAGKSCDAPCKTGAACDGLSGKCSYKANAVAKATCTNGTTDPGVCDGKGNCVADRCVGVACDAPCKTLGSCNPLDGKCTYRANAASKSLCTTATIDQGVCSSGTCLPDKCADKICELACKTGATCNPLDGRCSYSGNAPINTACSTVTIPDGKCDGRGNCVAK